jgi:hypothetical protein
MPTSIDRIKNDMGRDSANIALVLCGFAVIGTLAFTYGIADVRRIGSIPESFWGKWAIDTGHCNGENKDLIVLSAKRIQSDANCSVDWLAETADGSGSIYSARLQCTKPGSDKITVVNLMIQQDDQNKISVGPNFNQLQTYHRCRANEPVMANWNSAQNLNGVL